MRISRFFILILGLLLSGEAFGSSVFSYQGVLKSGDAAATGSFDMQFSLYDVSTNGAPVTTPIYLLAVPVTNGAFVVNLDFGSAAFTGSSRWLEVAVRASGDTNSLTVLSPRQTVNAVPYATYAYAARVANGAVTSQELAQGTILAANIATNQLVRSLNGLRDDVTLVGGDGISIAQLDGSTVGVSIGGGTNGSIILSNLLAGDGGVLTNISLASIGGITNLVAAGSSFPFEAMGSEYTAAGNGSGYSGTSFVCPLTNSLIATQIVFRTAATQGTNITLHAAIYNTPILPAVGGGGITGGILIWSNNITLPPGTQDTVITNTIPTISLTPSYYYLLISSDETNTFYKHYITSAADTRPPWIAKTTSASGWFVSGYHSYGFNIVGYNNFGGTNLAQVVDNLSQAVQSPSVGSANVSYNGANAGLQAQSVQAAIDELAGPLKLGQSALMIDGDSKSVGLGYVLKTNAWFSGLLFFTNAGTGGTSLAFQTNNWKTNTSLVSSKIGAGTNKYYVLWTMHNDFQGDINTEIVTLSNYVNQVASSNWHVILITTQPRATAVNADSPKSYKFLAAVNNWIRNSSNTFRVVDADALIEDCYNADLYVDNTHLTTLGYELVANELFKQLTSRRKFMPATRQAYTFGSNYVITASVSNGAPGLVAYGNTNQLHSQAILVGDKGLIVTNTAAPSLASIGATNVVVEWWSNSVPPVKYATYYDFKGKPVNKAIATFP